MDYGELLGNLGHKSFGDWCVSDVSIPHSVSSPFAGLLAFRIWHVKRQSSKYLNHNRLTPILRVVIESGAIYSFTITAALITFVTKSNGVYVLLDMVRPSPHFLPRTVF